ncbi:MAG: flavodoxin family protein [Balneolaceae bacterium]|nr:flavodoxin family protein [Balneolaceae bacterium]MCH8549159.1 flavodoxin family protein [Balneolaceae bacterium]
MARYLTLLIPILFFSYTASLNAQATVLIVYHSESGNTKAMAEAVAEGASGVEGAEVELLTVDEVKTDHLLEADAILVGSPVYNANVTPEISAFIASWPFEGQPLKDKIGAAFVTAGGISAGEELVQMNILQSMLVFGMIVAGGPDWTQPFGASAVTGEEPFASGAIDDQFLEKGVQLGKRIATLAVRLSDSE